MTMEKFMNLWKTQFSPKFRRCYSFTVPDEIKQLGIQKIMFDLGRHVFIFIHEEQQFSRMDPINKHVESINGQQSSYEVTYSVCKIIVI